MTPIEESGLQHLSPRAQIAIAHAAARIKRELDPIYTYHNYAHTFKGVLPAAVRLGELSNLPPETVNLLAVSAAFHDIGFTTHHENHEALGAEIAGKDLPALKFEPDEIRQIQGMIMATRFPQSPKTLAEQVLADADLDVLGREDFLTRNLALHNEMVLLGKGVSLHEWFAQQKKFLEAHTYFTEAAHQLRDDTKSYNIELLASQMVFVS